MLLPKQSPPVERKTNIATKTPAKDVKPQMTCACRENKLWCIIGRSYYNTGQPC
jgi:hypothetical protein